jgi:hypothetical protein
MEQAADLARLGVPARLHLGKDQLPVGDNLEDAPAARNELHLDLGELLPELGRHPGSPGLIASDDAIGNADEHGGLQRERNHRKGES